MTFYRSITNKTALSVCFRPIQERQKQESFFQRNFINE